MSAALERVIAEQQATIDRLKQVIDQNNDYLQKNYLAREKLAYAVFGVLNHRAEKMYFDALREEIRAQGWCLYCECLPCECDD